MVKSAGWQNDGALLSGYDYVVGYFIKSGML